MRILLFILNLMIGVSLAVHSYDGFAASSAKMGKNKAHKTSRSHAKKKKSSHPGDVWARIRSGMSIPHPQAIVHSTPGTYPPSVPVHRDGHATTPMRNATTTSVKLYASRLPQNNYTELGRQKLAKHNYTELGKRLLGSAPHPIGSSDCKPLISSKSSKVVSARGTGQASHTNLLLRPDREYEGNLRTRTVISAPSDSSRPSSYRPITSTSTGTSRFNRFTKVYGQKTPCPANMIAADDQSRSNNLGTKSKDQHSALNEARNLQATINDRIGRQINLYAQKQDFLYRVATRAHPYLFHIVEELHSHHLPLELALLPIVESAYVPTAESSKNARGLWQFIPSTGSDYHLEQYADYDERLDITESTRAAIRFLSGLNAHYHGDWQLALAAYNAGPGTVDQAIAENQAKGWPTDYWSLTLPQETQDYVPRFLALSKIFANPSSYGIKLPAVRNEPYFVKAKFSREFDVNYLADKNIDVVARLADLSSEQFCRLNPAFLGSRLSRRDAYDFLLPPNNAEVLRRNLASIAQFMSEPVMAVNSVVMKDNFQLADITDPSLSLISELVLEQPAHEAKFPAPFLSLNFDNDQRQTT